VVASTSRREPGRELSAPQGKIRTVNPHWVISICERDDLRTIQRVWGDHVRAVQLSDRLDSSLAVRRRFKDLGNDLIGLHDGLLEAGVHGHAVVGAPGHPQPGQPGQPLVDPVQAFAVAGEDPFDARWSRGDGGVSGSGLAQDP
jgi:hypothetical protein